MGKEEILKLLNKKYPLVTWTVEEEDNVYKVKGSYELAATMTVPKATSGRYFIEDLGEGYYRDLRNKVSIFPKK